MVIDFLQSLLIAFNALVVAPFIQTSDYLSEAVVEGKNQELVYLLKSGSDPNAKDARGLPLLVLAWQSGNLSAFEILLEMGANPHQVITEKLVTAGEQAISVGPGSSVLAFVIRNAHHRPGFVEVTLRYVRYPNQLDGEGAGFLHQMAHSPRSEFWLIPALMMLNSGTDANALNKKGLSAARTYFRDYYDRSKERQESPDTMLLSVRHCLFLGVNHNLISPDGSTLVDDLTLLEDSSVLKRLHGSDATPERLQRTTANVQELKAQIQSEVTPLMNLTKDGNLPSPDLKPMFRNGPKLKITATSSDSPEELFGFVDYLAAGGDLNVRGKAGFTLLWSVMHSLPYPNTFVWLVKNGAEPDLRLSDDLRLYLASEQFPSFSEGYFGVKGETVLMAACTNPYWRTNFVPPALAVTKQPNQTDLLERNLLHRLLYHPLLNGQDHLINDLIRAGVNPNAQTISGATPLHIAVALNPKAIPILVEAGADPTVRNMRGQTVEELLTIAIREEWPRQEDYPKVLEWLRERKKKRLLN